MGEIGQTVVEIIIINIMNFSYNEKRYCTLRYSNCAIFARRSKKYYELRPAVFLSHESAAGEKLPYHSISTYSGTIYQEYHPVLSYISPFAHSLPEITWRKRGRARATNSHANFTFPLLNLLP